MARDGATAPAPLTARGRVASALLLFFASTALLLGGCLAVVSQPVTTARPAPGSCDYDAAHRNALPVSQVGPVDRRASCDRLTAGTAAAGSALGARLLSPSNVVRFATEAASVTVEDLSGSTLSNYNRFVKNLPAAADTPTITNLADGAVEFSANVPATNIPGSYATYTKVVNADGVTTSFIKTTIAPDGSVVSVKVKFP